MYQCAGCEGIVEPLNGQCFCGKTTTDHKGRIKGEKYMKTNGQGIIEKTKVRTCPHCGWKGLVIPRINLGCPDHGIWWYKSCESKTLNEENNFEQYDCEDPEGRDDLSRAASDNRKKRRNDQNRQRLPRFNARR